MKTKEFTTFRLVKSEDLNHHGTLFAGRSAEWFVESGFVAAAHFLKPENIVCVKIHGLLFTKPVKRGEIINFISKPAYTGRTSLIVYIKMLAGENMEMAVDGFITFVNVDANGRPAPHNLSLIPETEEDRKLNKEARDLVKH